ncbi:MAG: ATPase [Archaeoglobi archaeon]|nr:Flp pilus assembly complex ATPase component TadA [Candidatus Mnemosynella bozhongmuii]MDK2781752.1 ATPase [Archaeoglobi archaeon]
MKVVPDTSVIVDGRITEMVERGELEGATIVVPEAVVAELENQANQGKETGFNGLAELNRLREMSEEGKIKLEYYGERPSLEDVRMAHSGAIDAIIRDVALKLGATFITSDAVQAEIARAKGLKVIYLEPEAHAKPRMRLLDFFDEKTMSVHLKEGVVPMAKRGSIEEMRYEPIGSEKLSGKELREMAREIIEICKKDPDAFIEIDRGGVTVAQWRDIRIAIARPPFSDGMEITAVRPLVKVNIDDYRFSEELKRRIVERQRGVLIAGPPGAGKSTFAAGVAEFLAKQGFLVKTMESPRDLQVSDEITQYGPLEGSMENTAEILLLVRPDYTIYDEMRRTRDFKIFADMRLAGVGMIGVVHATRAIDALQRLIGRVELGMIPQIVDTVIFIEKGQIKKVYDVNFTVKVPHGMFEADLARPVIEIIDFETGEVEYEIYTYGEQVVVMPIKGERAQKGALKIASREVKREIEKYARRGVEVEVVSPNKAVVYLHEKDIPRVLGKGGKTIEKIERSLGMSIDVVERDEREDRERISREEVIRPEIEETSKSIILHLGDLVGETVEVYCGDDYLFTATVGRSGDIRIKKGSAIANIIMRMLESGNEITVRRVRD